jgi:hypothetical protein
MNWGRKISTRLFINTQLKPISIGDRKDLYPLYVRVICLQQVAQFKFFGKDLEPRFFSKDEFEETFGTIDLSLENSELAEKAYGIALYSTLKSDIGFLLDYMDVFTTDNFRIKELPNVLRHYYEIEKISLKIIKRYLVKSLMKKGYDSIISIIDWNGQHPAAIETALLSLQEKFDLPKTHINFKELPFVHIREVLEILKEEKAGDLGSGELHVKKLMKKHFDKKNKNYDELVEELLVSSIQFIQDSRHELFPEVQ